MKIHEYQGKEILRKYKVAVPNGFVAFSVDEAVDAAKKLGGSIWVVKAQIHAGGRGKGGGVKVAKSLDEVRQFASQILGMNLITHQTGPEGKIVKRLLIEEGVNIARELYIGILLDRAISKMLLWFRLKVEWKLKKVAAETPEKLLKSILNLQRAFNNFKHANLHLL